MTYIVLKRALDVFVAATLLLLTGPLLFWTALRIKAEDRGPVFYAAPRVGRDGVEFRMLKFRSMVVNAASLGGTSTADDDPRLTKAGRWIRAWKIDELPQLVNVLRGEMSLVGPRPQVPSDVARYSEDDRRLLSVKPGVTDWASIEYRDEGRILAGHADPDEAYDRLIRPGKIALGLKYVAQRSLLTDLRILFQTVRVIVRDDSDDGVVT